MCLNDDAVCGGLRGSDWMDGANVLVIENKKGPGEGLNQYTRIRFAYVKCTRNTLTAWCF